MGKKDVCLACDIGYELRLNLNCDDIFTRYGGTL